MSFKFRKPAVIVIDPSHRQPACSDDFPQPRYLPSDGPPNSAESSPGGLIRKQVSGVNGGWAASRRGRSASPSTEGSGSPRGVGEAGARRPGTRDNPFKTQGSGSSDEGLPTQNQVVRIRLLVD